MNIDPMQKLRDSISDIEIDDLLGKVGLMRRPGFAAQALPSLGFFAMGFTVGAGVGLLFAPMKGQEMREKILEQLSNLARGEDAGETGSAKDAHADGASRDAHASGTTATTYAQA
ncbi:MAG TPA: YtxH domain-containing protein [Polyangiaceae bacterium LLY-WYZ-15_(1-7)]|nr:hypothetical protein [Sandaracinus sp.]HJK93949.1 YtxH domain-containing protein [Polyangiaceae bacterium LLY-WYZ-15_(1-7)]HJL03267.1 YtxH domain-containing protein [Polyangiaceae bacterium LLY-WYZ-15_(1-7)]HJL11203.1 YtxH domain-containing protein [Polyangiaceae bacterium LLY-WYZ-15_(1-7)]HJL25045.1 YtxH domain-containing protein [Polyangiaceae bacterium LLY-WYZ-15_(1-7)]